MAYFTFSITSILTGLNLVPLAPEDGPAMAVVETDVWEVIHYM